MDSLESILLHQFLDSIVTPWCNAERYFIFVMFDHAEGKERCKSAYYLNSYHLLIHSKQWTFFIPKWCSLPSSALIYIPFIRWSFFHHFFFPFTSFLAQSPTIQENVAAFSLAQHVKDTSEKSLMQNKKITVLGFLNIHLISVVVILQLGCNKYIFSRTAANKFLL